MFSAAIGGSKVVQMVGSGDGGKDVVAVQQGKTVASIFEGATESNWSYVKTSRKKPFQSIKRWALFKRSKYLLICIFVLPIIERQ